MLQLRLVKLWTIFFLLKGFIFPLTLTGQSHSNFQPEQFKVTSWTADNGLPGNTCISIVQDKLGYLWIGSFDGLSRFDGSEFITYNKENKLNSNYALAVSIDNESNLWIGSRKGLIKYSNGKFTSISYLDAELYIESMLVDTLNNTLWLGTRNKGLITYKIKDDQFEQVAGIEDENIINDIKQDKDGGFWIAGEKNGLTKFFGKKWRNFSNANGIHNNEIKSLSISAEGKLFVGTSSGLFIRKNDTTFYEHAKFKGIRINKVAHDLRNRLWIGTAKGLYYEYAINKWQFINHKTGLSNDDIRDIFFSKDGAVWIGTYRGGLNQLRPTMFKGYFAQEGLDVEATGALCMINDSTLLIGSTQGQLFTLINDKVKLWTNVTQINERIYSILKDNKENIWVASYDGLLLVTPQGKETLFTQSNGLPTNQIRVIYQDKNNEYWVGTRNSGLLKMQYSVNAKNPTPAFSHFKYDEFKKLQSTFIMDIAEDSNNNLIISSNAGGVTILNKNGTLENYTTNNGLQSNTVFSAKSDKQNVIWIAASDGLSRLKDGKIFSFTRKEGMPHENPVDFAEDKLGYVWIPTHIGAIRVSKQQLNDYADKKIKAIDWKLFDKSNDLIKSECNGTSRTLVEKNGRIWIPMTGGLTTVDPAIFKNYTKMPPVKATIESISIDNLEVDLGQTITVEPGEHRIEIKFTALNLFYPNSYTYKYKLMGFDTKWNEIGKSKQVTFTGLRNGTYDFKIQACNSDGVWSTAPTSISFRVLPRFYETVYFYAVSIALVALLGFTFYKWKVRNVKQRAVELERKVAERTTQLTLKSAENEMLYSLSSSLIAPIELDTLLQHIMKAAIALIPNAQGGSILLLNKEKDTLEGRFSYDIPLEQIKKIKIKVGEGNSGKAIKQGYGYIENNVPNPEFIKTLDLPELYKKSILSILVVLLKVKEEIIGTISLENREMTGAFTEKDFSILNSLSANASVAIERVRMQNEIERQIEIIKESENKLQKSKTETEILYDLSSNLIAPIELNRLLRNIIETAVKLVAKAQGGSIYLLDSSRNTLQGIAAFGIIEDEIQNVKIKVGEGQAGRAVAEKRNFINNHVQEDYIIKHNLVRGEKKPIQSVIVVLLKKNEESIIGTLSIDNYDQHEAFSEHDLEILTLVAANASVAIERVRMQHEIERQMEVIQHSERLHRKNEQKLKEAFRLARLASWEADMINKVVFLTPEFCNILGIPYNENQAAMKFGDYIHSYVHPEDVESMNYAYQNVMESGKDIEPFSYRIIRKDGTVAWVSVLAVKVTRDDTSSQLSFGWIQDVTRQKKIEKDLIQSAKELELKATSLRKANEELIELDKYKESMTAMIVHDFKNSLNTVISFSEGTPTERRLRSIRQAGQFMLNMVLNILDVQKFESASAKMSLANYAVDTLISEAVDQLSYLIEQKAIKLTYKPTEQLYCRMDHDLTVRVIVNILSNAIKYVSQNGKIDIVATRENDFVRIAIRDNGIGIPADKIHLVFEKYVQINAQKSGGVRSTGIGLTFCKMVVENLGGSISVESEEGKGSTFYFTLPFVNEDLSEGTPKETLILLNEQEIILNDEEQAALKPSIKKLRQWEVYDYSEIAAIIEEIENSNNNIASWKDQLMKAVQTGNEELYNQLLKR